MFKGHSFPTQFFRTEKEKLFKHNKHNIQNKQVFDMVSITLSVPEELKKKMDLYQEINWSAVAREAINKKLLILQKMDQLLEKSELTEDDTIQLGRELTKRVAKKYKDAS